MGRQQGYNNNSEVAEFDVIKDSVETGLVKKANGFSGLLDDVLKIDLKRDWVSSLFVNI